MINMPDTFSIDLVSLQISPFQKWSYTVSGPFLQIYSANMERWNIFLIEALSMLTSLQIKTVKPPNKKPCISDRPSFLHQRSVKFQSVWQKLRYNIPLAGLLQKHVGLHVSPAKYQKSFVCLRKMCRLIETMTCQWLISVCNLN